MDCGNTTVLGVSWYQAPPYFHEDKHDPDLITGGMYRTLSRMLRDCCGSNYSLDLSGKRKGPREVVVSTEDVFLLPVVRSQTMMVGWGQVEDHVFMPIIESPGNYMLILTGTMLYQLGTKLVKYLNIFHLGFTMVLVKHMN